MADIRYTISDLGILPGFVNVSAKAINDRGQIIGDLGKGLKSTHSFLWDSGQMHPVGPVTLNDINNQGQAVGRRYNPKKLGLSQSVIYHDRRISPLWNGGSLLSYAKAINDSGQVVGYVSTAPDKNGKPKEIKQDGFIWQGGQRRELSLLPSYRSSKAFDVNNQGTVTGSSKHAQPDGSVLEHAVLWDGETATLLGSLPGYPESRAVAINNRGQVLGRAIYSKMGEVLKAAQQKFAGPSGQSQLDDLQKVLDVVLGEINALPKDESIIRQQSFFWDEGRIKEIDGLALEINDQGQVVGWSGCDFSGKGPARDAYAFLWQDGQLFDLNTLIPPDTGWTLGRANGINNHGQIVGSGAHNAMRRAFLLTPEES